MLQESVCILYATTTGRRSTEGLSPQLTSQLPTSPSYSYCGGEHLNYNHRPFYLLLASQDAQALTLPVSSEAAFHGGARVGTLPVSPRTRSQLSDRIESSQDQSGTRTRSVHFTSLHGFGLSLGLVAASAPWEALVGVGAGWLAGRQACEAVVWGTNCHKAL